MSHRDYFVWYNSLFSYVTRKKERLYKPNLLNKISSYFLLPLAFQHGNKGFKEQTLKWQMIILKRNKPKCIFQQFSKKFHNGLNITWPWTLFYIKNIISLYNKHVSKRNTLAGNIRPLWKSSSTKVAGEIL